MFVQIAAFMSLVWASLQKRIHTKYHTRGNLRSRADLREEAMQNYVVQIEEERNKESSPVK